MPDYLDPASSPEFIAALQVPLEGLSILDRDAVLRGARLWESHRAKLAEETYTRIYEIDDASKELLAARVDRIADRCIAHMRDYSAVPDHPDASAAYTAFERSHRALVVALVAGEFGMAVVRSLEVAPSGKARVVTDLFQVDMLMDEKGHWAPRYAREFTEQQVRQGRVAWVAAYARLRANDGLAVEEAHELTRIATMAADGELPITETHMRTVDYVFERLQPGWALLSTDAGRQEMQATERTRGRDTCRSLLRDFPDRWNSLEREFLEQLPQRPDADLLPPIVAEVHRLHERELRRDEQKLARDRIAEIRPHAARDLTGMTPNEALSYGKLLAVPVDRDLTPYELSDAEVLHDKVLSIVEGA